MYQGIYSMKELCSKSWRAISASISDNIFKQYSVYWEKWWNFCRLSNHNLFGYNLIYIIQFLNNVFNASCTYASVNYCKAALSFILDIEDDDKNFLRRFMKGLYNQRPSALRYEETWDPHTVLEFLEKLYPLESLSLFQFPLKLVALLALTYSHRIQTFSKIMVNDISVSTTDLEKTKDVRPQGERKLILTHKKLHNAATRQTLSRWLKWVLENCNIDTNVFKRYSFKHASTSAALRGGANIETIRKSAGSTTSQKRLIVFIIELLSQESFCTRLFSRV
nr:unnamed protein product [Callosobruchus chinensis]